MQSGYGQTGRGGITNTATGWTSREREVGQSKTTAGAMIDRTEKQKNRKIERQKDRQTDRQSTNMQILE